MTAERIVCVACFYCDAHVVDGGFCSVCGSPLHKDSKPHPLYERARLDERAAIVAYIKKEAASYRQLAAPGWRLTQLIVDLEGLAGFFEDGGHLR